MSIDNARRSRRRRFSVTSAGRPRTWKFQRPAVGIDARLSSRRQQVADVPANRLLCDLLCLELGCLSHGAGREVCVTLMVTFKLAWTVCLD